MSSLIDLNVKLEFEDDEFPKSYIDHDRLISRAVLLNEKNEIAFIHLSGDDIFGHRDYYELPGGGVNQGESLEDAVRREIHEEVGYSSYVLAKIGTVYDYYNLIHRHNLNNYFLLRTKNKHHQHLEEYEKKIIKGITWISLDSVLEVLDKQQKTPIEKLVFQREFPIVKAVYDFYVSGGLKEDKH